MSSAVLFSKGSSIVKASRSMPGMTRKVAESSGSALPVTDCRELQARSWTVPATCTMKLVEGGRATYELRQPTRVRLAC